MDRLIILFLLRETHCRLYGLTSKEQVAVTGDHNKIGPTNVSKNR